MFSARITAGLLILAASLSRAFATDYSSLGAPDGISPAVLPEAPSFASPDAIRQGLDEAAPELLHLNDCAIEILNKVGPRDFVKVHDMQRQMKQQAETFGAPLGWDYVGERKLGDVARQYVYVYRYAGAPLVLHFLAMRRNDRWSLSQYKANGESDALLAEAPVDRSSKPADYCGLCDRFVDRLVHGDREVVPTFKGNFTQSFPTEKFDCVAFQLAGAAALFGGVVSCNRVEVKNVSDVLAQCSYLVPCQNNNGLFSRITLYRADKDWKIINIGVRSFDMMEDRMAGASLEPARARNTPQTVCRPKQPHTDPTKVQ